MSRFSVLSRRVQEMPSWRLAVSIRGSLLRERGMAGIGVVLQVVLVSRRCDLRDAMMGRFGLDTGSSARWEDQVPELGA